MQAKCSYGRQPSADDVSDEDARGEGEVAQSKRSNNGAASEDEGDAGGEVMDYNTLERHA